VFQGALISVILAALAWRAGPDGRLHVAFLATQGDAALIQTPAGGYVLIDGGAEPAALTVALGRQMPFWCRTLDAVVLSIPDAAHLPGQVAALARYRARVAIAPPMPKPDLLLDEWRRLLKERATPIHIARPGDQINLDGATLRVLAIGDGVDSGMVLRLDYGATSVLFDHVGGSADEEALLASGLLRPATLVAFPWQRDPHAPIVAALHPRALVLTDGQQAARPIEQTFVERTIGGAHLFHERLDGMIEWSSDGTRAWITTER
jgi:beta-lactamase superfamily II metal-dependent hydrolase